MLSFPTTLIKGVNKKVKKYLMIINYAAEGKA